MSQTTSAAPSIHGHEVLNLLLSANPFLTPDELQDEVTRRFGADARFHTCSAADLTLHGLLAFLLARGKFALVDGRMQVNPATLCNHAD